MRAFFIAAALVVASGMGQVASAAPQEAAPEMPPAVAAPATPVAPETVSDPGVMAPIADPEEPVAVQKPPRRRAASQARGDRTEVAPQLAQALPPPPIEAPTLAYQLGMIRAEEAHLDVLKGRSGPFMQAITAWKVRDWYHFTFAMMTLLIWSIVLAIMVAITRSVLRRRREDSERRHKP